MPCSKPKVWSVGVSNWPDEWSFYNHPFWWMWKQMNNSLATASADQNNTDIHLAGGGESITLSAQRQAVTRTVLISRYTWVSMSSNQAVSRKWKSPWRVHDWTKGGCRVLAQHILGEKNFSMASGKCTYRAIIPAFCRPALTINYCEHRFTSLVPDILQYYLIAHAGGVEMFRLVEQCTMYLWQRWAFDNHPLSFGRSACLQSCTSDGKPCSPISTVCFLLKSHHSRSLWCTKALWLWFI